MTETRTPRADRYLSGLKPQRKKAGMNQTELARAAGTSKQSIRMWEIGECWPSAEWLPKLAAALGCEIKDLFAPENREGGAE